MLPTEFLWLDSSLIFCYDMYGLLIETLQGEERRLSAGRRYNALEEVSYQVGRGHLRIFVGGGGGGLQNYTSSQ